MNQNDYRLRAYNNSSLNAKEKTEPKKSEPVDQTFTKSVKKSRAQNDYKVSPELEGATDALKHGGLIKVPLEPGEGGKESVYRRVAKFLLLLGVDNAADIMKYLSQEETEKIILEITSIRTITDEEATEILEEFHSLAERVKEGGGRTTAKTILEKAFGTEKGNAILTKAAGVPKEKPFAYLAEKSNDQILLLLKDESSAVKALVLSNLVPAKAAAVIKAMDNDDKKEVVMRLAKLKAVSPEVIDRINTAMHEKALALTDDKTTSIDGRSSLAQILKRMDMKVGQELIEELSYEDPELGKDLRSKLFTIEDVVNADDRFIQEYLREMSDADAAYLIAGKSEDFRQKILSNVSHSRGDTILEEERIRKPMRKKDCDEITNSFFAKLRKAYEEGKLRVTGREDDVYVE